MTETDGTDTFSDAQNEAIIEALICGSSYRQAARSAGVSKSAVGRRMQDPTFRSTVEQSRMSALHRTGHRLGEMTGEALDVYESVLASEDASFSQRLRAAEGVLSSFRTFSVEIAMANRLTAIEERLEAAEELADDPKEGY